MDSTAISDLSVLIIDPSITSVRFVEDQLKSLQVHNFECCGSGTEALASMHKYAPDLVASSMYLPDMTATELLGAMREDPKLEDIPFMLISTETSFAKLDPIRQAGIIALLPKPFTAEDMRKALIGSTRFIDTSKSAGEDTDLSQLKVLVVDDSPLSRKHISRVLTNLGIEDITEAEDGSVAVEILDRDFFDIVFTDFNMPEMDGDKLILYLRNNSMQPDIPVLMVTSEEDESRLAAVVQAGVSGICNKPFDTDTVLKMIQRIFSES